MPLHGKKTKRGVKPLTRGYEPGPRDSFYQQPRDLPLFGFWIIRMMLMEPTIRLGLAMRAAPICSAEFAYKEDGSDEYTPGIKADNPEVAKFAHEQYKRIWKNELEKLLTAQVWGWAACEVMYTQNDKGQIEVGEFLARRARDVQPLVVDGRLVGVRFMRIKGGEFPFVDIEGTKCLWHAHCPEDDSLFGESICRGAYSPWADKWLNGGALDVRRLAMHKDAYGGSDITYPEGTVYIDGKGEVPNRDIAREIVEQLKAGGVTTRPAAYDEKGNELWKLTRATAMSGLEYILKYPQDLDTEMLRGLEIPDDVLESETTGAWQGKQVPQQAFYTSLNRWGNRLVRDIKPCVQFAVDCTFGPGQQFEPELKPLDATMSEQEGSKDPSEGPPQASQPPQYGQQQLMRQPPQPVQMGLDADGNEHDSDGRFASKGKGGERGATAISRGKKYRTAAPRAKLNIDQATDMLKERGYEIGPPQVDLPTKATYYVVQKNGEKPIVVKAKQIAAFLATEDDDIAPHTRLALDPEAAVGEGVLSAAELVTAAKRVMKIRLAADREGHEHKGKGPGGGQFTSKGGGGSGGAVSTGKAAPKKLTPAKSSATAKRKPPPRPRLSEKAQRAKDNHHMVDKTIQRYAEEHNEPKFAKAIGGVSFPNGEPIDIAIAGPTGKVAHGIELKTMVENKNNKITMKRSAMERKAEWEKKNKATCHTVVIDDSAVFNARGDGNHDESKRKIFYRRGYGSFRVGTMHQVKNVAELRQLLDLPNAKLPPAAQRPQ